MRTEARRLRAQVDGFMQNHRKMIREMRGLPGVIPERFEEAKTIRHCALSLVRPRPAAPLTCRPRESAPSGLVTDAPSAARGARRGGGGPTARGLQVGEPIIYPHINDFLRIPPPSY